MNRKLLIPGRIVTVNPFNEILDGCALEIADGTIERAPTVRRETSFISLASRRTGLRLGNGLRTGQIYRNGCPQQHGWHAVL